MLSIATLNEFNKNGNCLDNENIYDCLIAENKIALICPTNYDFHYNQQRIMCVIPLVVASNNADTVSENSAIIRGFNINHKLDKSMDFGTENDIIKSFNKNPDIIFEILESHFSISIPYRCCLIL